jgi:hypothetical protein
MRLLLIGASGMLGSTVLRVLSGTPGLVPHCFAPTIRRGFCVRSLSDSTGHSSHFDWTNETPSSRPLGAGPWPESLSATGYVRIASVLRIVEAIVRLICRNVDLLLVQSETFVPSVKSLASGTPVEYHANSADDPSEVADGGTHPRVIIEAAIQLRERRNILLVAVGDGSRWDWWEWMLGRVREHRLTNVRLPGRLPAEEMPPLMSAV